MSAEVRASDIWLVATVLLAMAGCTLSVDDSSLNEAGISREPLLLKVNVIEAQQSEDVYQTSSYFGTIKPKRSSYLSFSKGGRVAEVLKEVGEQVESDEQLAKLDQEELENQQEELNESLDSLRERLSRLNPNSRSSSAQSQRNRLNQQIESLEAQQRELDRELEKGIITAPYQGILAERNIDAGNDFPVGQAALKIVEDAPPIVEIHMTSDLAEQVALEQAVWLRDGQELVETKVAYKSPELSQGTLTRRLILELSGDDPNRSWVYGDTVEAQFWLASDQSGYWLPYSALQREQDGLWAAFVVVQQGEKQVVERRMIEVVQLTDDHALVSGSIENGDLVIVDGSNRITPGQQVTPEVVTASFSQTGPPRTGE